MAGKNPDTVPVEGAVVTVHWLRQIGDAPDVQAENSLHRSGRLRLISGVFQPFDSEGREMLDESIAFKRRADAETAYREFILKEIDTQDLRRGRLAAAVRAGDVAQTLRVLAGDICFWAFNLKDHLLHTATHLAKDPSFVRMVDVPEGAPVQYLPGWLVRDWIGASDAVDLLEFHKSPEYAQSFSARLDRLYEAAMALAGYLNKYVAQHRGEDVEGLLVLDEMRKDLKHLALRHVEHLDRVAAQFDAAKAAVQVPPVATSTPVSSGVAPASCGSDEKLQEPRSFQGGEVVFLADHVELCGVDICSGPRSQKRRRILQLLCMKEASGRFKPYSGEELAVALGPKCGQGTVAGAIRDLRDEIMAALRTNGNLLCGHKDVILSRGRGYRLAESITVAGGDHGAEDAGDTDDDLDDPGACLVLNAPDDPAVGRATWILERLAEGAQLRAPDVAQHFRCSVKTAQRALKALRGEGKIEFVGASRTGYYRLRQRPGE